MVSGHQHVLGCEGASRLPVFPTATENGLPYKTMIIRTKAGKHREKGQDKRKEQKYTMLILPKHNHVAVDFRVSMDIYVFYLPAI